MSERVSWITHKGKKILFVDASKLRGAAYLQVFEEMEALYRTLPQRSTLVLLDVTDSFTPPDAVATQKALVTYQVATHTAVVGVTGIKQVIAQAIRKDLYYVSSVEAGKDWLVQQS